MMISVSGDETIVLFSSKRNVYHLAVELAQNERILIHSDSGILTICCGENGFEITEKEKNQNAPTSR